MRTRATLGCLVIAMLSLLGSASAAPVAATTQKPTPQSARERWDAMTPEDRSLMHKRFKALKGMKEGRRRELRERHGRLKEGERRAWDQLPGKVRKELDALAPEKRREVLRELGNEEVTERGRNLRERLPVEVQQRLEAAPPEERRALLDEFMHEHRAKGMRKMAERLRGEPGLAPAELAELETLPPAEREHRLLELKARSIRSRAERDGPPRWLSEVEWQHMKELAPGPFLDAFNAYRRRSGVPGAPGSTRAGRDDRKGSGGPPWPHGLARPDPSWRVELSGLTPEQRYVEIEVRVRQRVEDHLAQHPEALDAEQRKALESARGREFFDLLRKISRPGMRAERGAEGRRPGEHRRGEPRGEGKSGRELPGRERGSGRRGPSGGRQRPSAGTEPPGR